MLSETEKVQNRKDANERYKVRQKIVYKLVTQKNMNPKDALALAVRAVPYRFKESTERSKQVDALITQELAKGSV